MLCLYNIREFFIYGSEFCRSVEIKDNTSEEMLGVPVSENVKVMNKIKLIVCSLLIGKV